MINIYVGEENGKFFQKNLGGELILKNAIKDILILKYHLVIKFPMLLEIIEKMKVIFNSP